MKKKYIYSCIALLFSTGIYAQDYFTDSIIKHNYQYKIYDTVMIKNRTFKYINHTDIKGNQHVRDSINQNPCFIYYFASHCPPCSFAMPMLNRLYEEFKDRIDFLAFTPIPAESIAEFYNGSKMPKFPVISVPRSHFKGGFPDLFILDCKNIIVFNKYGGSIDEKEIAVDYKVLHEWCEKVLNKK